MRSTTRNGGSWLSFVCPESNGDVRSVNHTNSAKDDDADINCFLAPSFSNCFQMEQWREQETKGNTIRTPDQADKLIQVSGAQDGYQGAEQDTGKSKHVLLPLDNGVVLARFGKEASFNDTNGREELQGNRQTDTHSVQALDGVDKRRYRQVEQDDSLHLVTKGEVRKEADRDEEQCDEQHGPGQDLGELLGLLHGFGDGDDQANAFKGKHGSTNEHGERRCVDKPFNLADTLHSQHEKVIVIQVSQADQNEGIGNQCENRQFLDLSYHSQWHKDGNLDQNQVIQRNLGFTVRDGFHQGLKTLCDKDHVGTHKTDLSMLYTQMVPN